MTLTSNNTSQNSTTSISTISQNSNSSLNSIQTRKSIETYGQDSETFASIISKNSTWMSANPNNSVAIISSVSNNLANLKLNMQKASCTVLINLPKDNGLYDVSTVKITTAAVSYDSNQIANNTIITENQTAYPTYWIAVIQKGTTNSITELTTLNDSAQVRQTIWNKAIELTTTDTQNSNNAINADQLQTSTSNSIVQTDSLPSATWSPMSDFMNFYNYMNSQDYLFSSVQIYELNAYDSGSNHEFWEVLATTNHYLPDYQQTDYTCAPFIYCTNTRITAGSSASIYQYGPPQTSVGSQVTISIGFDISQNGVGFSAGYSWTHDNPSVLINTGGNANYENWQDIYNCPDYHSGLWRLYGGYTGAPAESHNQWETRNDAVFYTTKGSGFPAGTVANTWTWYYDAVPQSLWEFYHTTWRIQSTYERDYNWGNLPSIFGAIYASSVVSTSTSGPHGIVTNANNLLGSSLDANYANIYGADLNDGGQITVQLNTAVSSGHVYIYGKSQSGYYSHLTVLVSPNGNTWTQISDQYVDSYYSTGWLHWIDCGSYSGAFSYVRVQGYDAYDSVNLLLDCLYVMGTPVPVSIGYVSSIVSSGYTGTSAGVGSITNLVGSSVDGNYATMHAGDYGSTAWIIGAMNTQIHGDIILKGCWSHSGYNTHFQVFVSSDGSSWTQVKDYYPLTSTTPMDIDCGTYSNNFSYIKIMALDSNGMSADLNVDCVKVQ